MGVNDACFAVLEPRGVSVAVYPCNAPTACMARYVLDVPASRVFPGPNPANALAAATSGSFGILRMTGAGGGQGAGGGTPHGRGTMAPAAGDGGGAARLAAGEAVLQVTWQGFGDDAGGVAVLTNRRLLLMEWSGCGGGGGGSEVMTLTTRGEVHRRDDGAAAATSLSSSSSCPIASCLWVGPSLLFTRERGGVAVLGWDGMEHTAAAAAVGGGGGALLAATEDAAFTLHPTNGSDVATSASSSTMTATTTTAPAVVSRPLAMLDVLAVGWGTLAAARRGAGLSPPAGVAAAGAFIDTAN